MESVTREEIYISELPSLPSMQRRVPPGHRTESSILYLHSPIVRPKYIVRLSRDPLIQDSLTHNIRTFCTVHQCSKHSRIMGRGIGSLCSILHRISLAHHLLKKIRSIFNLTKKFNTHTMLVQKCSPLLLSVHFVL